MNTFKDWMKENFEINELKDISTYGCSGGFHGLIYYSETTTLYQEYKDEIWENLYDDAESFGCKNIYELIAGFGGAKDVGSSDQHENLMVWYLAEKYARELTEETDENTEDEE